MQEKIQSRDDDLHNSWLLEYSELYRRFREAGYTVTITDADHLVQNPLGIKLLFVANPLMLSQEERNIIDEFIENGGQVYEIKLAEPERPAKPVKVLDNKGNVVRTINA